MLLALTLFLLAFIPLFPKIPLFDALPGYIVRVRIEDVLVLVTGMVWLTQVISQRINWRTTAFYLVVAYALVGLLSVVLGIVLLETIPSQLLHIGKSGLHYFRYMEYFALFFFAFGAFKKKTHLVIFLVVLAMTVVMTAGYGYGQKNWHWPLYSTMNREYSKGEKLYLSEHARIQSTFAGHYDLTAYLVLVLPVLLAVTFATKNRRLQIVFLTAQVAGVWLLIVGASKSSFLAYGLTIAVLAVLKYQLTHPGINRILKGGLIIGLAGLAIGGLWFWQRDQALSQKNRPDDVYLDAPEIIRQANVSETGEVTYTFVKKEETWSQNALRYGLSMGIRLDTLWPQAIRGFIRNPLTGSAYATLAKERTEQYTEADSTDNNYLRILGETGLLGFLTFFAVVAYVLRIAWMNLRSDQPLIAYLNLGFIAGTLGLFINALTIDVFSASKVAFTFWGLAGVVVASYYLAYPKQAVQEDKAFLQRLKAFFWQHRIFIVGLLLIFFAVHQDPFTERSGILNFDQNLNGSEQVMQARCLLRASELPGCEGLELFMSQLNPYAWLLIPFLAVFNNPGVYYVANFLVLLAGAWLFYSLLKKVTASESLQAAGFLTLVATPWLQTSVGQPTAECLWFLILTIWLSVAQVFSGKIKAIVVAAGGLVLLTQPHTHLALAAFVLIALVAGWQRWQGRPRPSDRLIMAVVVILVAVSFLRPGRLHQIATNFRDTNDYWNYRAVQRVNTFFYNYLLARPATTDSKPTLQLITVVNPYYFALFNNGIYQLLPLSQSQRHFDHPEPVWGKYDYSNLIQLYAHELKNNLVFVTNYGLDDSTQKAFDEIHQHFDLFLAEIGCNYTCNLYQVLPETEKVSPSPVVIARTLDLKTLGETYQFSVMSNRFQSTSTQVPRTLLTSIPVYQKVASSMNFTVAMGDLLPSNNPTDLSTFNRIWLAQNQVPLLYAPGNYDLQPTKVFPDTYHYFFTQDDLFVFLKPDATGQLDEIQQQFLLNVLLDVDKLPEIKNIFIFSDRAIWTDYDPNLQELESSLATSAPMTDDPFVTEQLLPTLEKWSDRSVYLISGDLKPDLPEAAFVKKLENSNLQFLATSLTNSPGGRYVVFKKNQGSWEFEVQPLK